MAKWTQVDEWEMDGPDGSGARVCHDADMLGESLWYWSAWIDDEGYEEREGRCATRAGAQAAAEAALAEMRTVTDE